MKTCTKCSETKTLEEFHRHIGCTDGRDPWCKLCKNFARQIWHKNNWQRRRESNRRYYHANKEKHQEAKQRWYKENREKKLEYDRLWREKNRDRQLKNVRRWHKENKERTRELDRRRRARKLGAQGAFTTQQWVELCKTHKHICLCCGEKKPLTVDHVIPLSKGGSNDISNIQPLCMACNMSKGTKTIDFRTIREAVG